MRDRGEVHLTVNYMSLRGEGKLKKDSDAMVLLVVPLFWSPLSRLKPIYSIIFLHATPWFSLIVREGAKRFWCANDVIHSYSLVPAMSVALQRIRWCPTPTPVAYLVISFNLYLIPFIFRGCWHPTELSFEFLSALHTKTRDFNSPQPNFGSRHAYVNS